MSDDKQRMMEHIKKLMSEHEHKYVSIPYGQLKSLDLLLSNQLLDIRHQQFPDGITYLLVTGATRTILSLNISMEDLPSTKFVLELIKNEH